MEFEKKYTYNEKQFLIDHQELWDIDDDGNYVLKGECPPEIVEYVKIENELFHKMAEITKNL